MLEAAPGGGKITLAAYVLRGFLFSEKMAAFCCEADTSQALYHHLHTHASQAKIKRVVQEKG